MAKIGNDYAYVLSSNLLKKCPKTVCAAIASGLCQGRAGTAWRIREGKMSYISILIGAGTFIAIALCQLAYAFHGGW